MGAAADAARKAPLPAVNNPDAASTTKNAVSRMAEQPVPKTKQASMCGIRR
jgi:hypothetical protein